MSNKVSIIIPVFNCQKYVGYAIESALNQTYEDVEVIVIDDGSFDDTLDIITQFDGITVLVKNNGGTASALNEGIKTAKGDWIHWLSADDVLHTTAIENMMNIIKDKDKIYYTNYDVIDESGTVIGEFIEPVLRNLKSIQDKKTELMSFYYGNGSTSMIHKSVFKKIGHFDEELAHSEDYEFWLRAISHGIDLWNIPIKTLYYRRHPDQLTNKVGGSLDTEIRNKYV